MSSRSTAGLFSALASAASSGSFCGGGWSGWGGRYGGGPCLAEGRRLGASVLAAALAFACGGDAAPGGSGRSGRPNVVLITLDTTRADRLGVYGYERPTSPNLDALASESTVYENAYSTSSWTLPAHASLFTGKYPSSHGAHHDPEGGLVLAEGIAAAPEAIRARPMSGAEQPLAGILGAQGWATAGIVAGPWMLRQFGLAAGFDHWDDAGIRDASGRRAASVTDGALAWLESAPDPFFLFVNYFDPHFPYAPPRGWARSFLPPGTAPNPRSAQQAGDLYDGEILYMDHEMGRLFRALREDGRWEQTLVVVTSDHGEFLGDRELWGHERYLWEPLVRVPLVVKEPLPAPEARREKRRVSVVDVLPLVLEQVGVAPPEGVQGTAPPGRAGAVLAEVHPMSATRDTGVWKARWEGRFKFLRSDRGERHLYDLESDADESHNLVAADPERARRAEQALDAELGALPPPPRAAPLHIDAETREVLRRLGYLEGPDDASRSQTRSDSSE